MSEKSFRPFSPGRSFLLLLIVFISVSFMGYAFAVFNSGGALNMTRSIAQRIGPLYDSSFKNFLKIFTNNLTVAFFMMLSGLFFGLGPWLIMGFNGFIVGVVVRVVQEVRGLSTERILLGLLPHGVFEIPALALAGTAGIVWYREIVGKGEEAGKGFHNGALKALKLFAASVLLLLIAAFIEAYITPRVAGLR